MRFVLEMDFRLFELAESFHEAFLVRIDEDIVDGRILEQGLDRTKTRHFVDDFLGECLQLFLVEGKPLVAHIFAEIGTNLTEEVLARELFQGNKIELVNDSLMQLELLVEQRRPLGHQFVVVLECSRIGGKRDNVGAWPRSGSARNIGEKVHFRLTLCCVIGRFVFTSSTSAIIYWNIWGYHPEIR